MRRQAACGNSQWITHYGGALHLVSASLSCSYAQLKSRLFVAPDCSARGRDGAFEGAVASCYSIFKAHIPGRNKCDLCTGRCGHRHQLVSNLMSSLYNSAPHDCTALRL